MRISLSTTNISVNVLPQNFVRIGIVAPYVKACWRKYVQGGVCRNIDYETEFIVMLVRALNCKYVFVPTDDFGYPYANDSTQWSGLVTKSLLMLVKRPF